MALTMSKAEREGPQIHMMGGSGKDSYSQNSAPQNALVASLLDQVGEALQHVLLPSSATSCISLADLGCSSGPNTIRNMNHIVQKLRALTNEKHRLVPLSSRSPAVPFQVFFNDVPSTDFNNLFRLLTAGVGEAQLPDCFVAGVPGSFYDRLFPNSSIHVFFSSVAVHYLSKIADEVLDKNSPAYNKHSEWLIGATPATATAYKNQASDDLRRFLRNRATELVPGGLLFIAMPARRDHDAVEECIQEDPNLMNLYCMNKAVKQLVSKGLIHEDTLAAFNIPVYFRTEPEILLDVESCSELFEVKKIEILYRSLFKSAYPDEILKNPEKLSEALLRTVCGGLGPLVQNHVGNQNYESFKELLEPVLVEHAVPNILGTSPLCVLSLIRTNLHSK